MPCVLADPVIPMVFWQWDLMVYALIPVIAIEFLVVRRRVPLSQRQNLSGIAFANIVSTIIGVPLAYLATTIVQLAVPAIASPVVSWASPRWGLKHLSPPVYTLLTLLGNFANYPYPSENVLRWYVAAAVGLLMIPTYFVSVWLEDQVCRMVWKDKVQPAETLRAVTIANRASYGFLFLLTCLLTLRAAFFDW